jgi:hypothetical protein
MLCLKNITVDTLLKGYIDDDENNNNNNNNNNIVIYFNGLAQQL